MSIYSRLRRIEVNEGDVYRVTELIGPINEDFNARDFLSDDKIPHEFRVYDPNNPVKPTRDIKKLCERDLSNLTRGGDFDVELISTDDLSPKDNFGSTYCNLYNTYQHLMGSDKKDDFIDNLSRVFWFVRPNLYDNRVKFHNLMRVILRGDQEHIFESVRTLSDKIKTSYSDDNTSHEAVDIKRALDNLSGKSNLSIEELKHELNSTKYKAYTLYEKSFESGPFVRSSKIFRLKYKESLEENGFKHLLDIAYDKIYNSNHISGGDHGQITEVIDDTADKLHNAIIDLYGRGQASKSDLVSTDDVRGVGGETIIKNGNFVEVKMRDYKSDSYLSEFFAIFKNSNINPKYKSPEMIKIYNGVITTLYNKIKSYDGGILTDIKNSFSGMFFGEKEHKGKMMPIYIPSTSIDLYWSDKGKVESDKQKRLSIRYRVKDNPHMFFYDRDTHMFMDEYLYEDFTIGEIKSVLTEGRKENAREKYPNVSGDVYEFFVNNDPSGNHKYIDWLMRNHEKGHTYSTASIRMGYVKFFHEYPQFFDNKDINSYNNESLLEAVVIGRGKLEKKEEEKKAKKQRDIVYKDSRWLVVSPKTHTASCYYGAGTKWCVTMKDSDQYWDRYSKNSNFFFIIDNTKTQEDPLYKVAYRMIGRRGKTEMWDATDSEFYNSARGVTYRKGLPKSLLDITETYHQQTYPKGEDKRDEWIDDDPRAQALVNHLGHFDIADEGDYFYSMGVYQDLDVDEWYAVGNESEADEALREYYYNYSDEELLEYYDPDGYHLSFDSESFIDREVDDMLDNNYSDKEIVENAGKEDDYDDLEEQRDDLDNSVEDDMTTEELDDIKSQSQILLSQLEDIIDESRELVRGYLTEEWELCFRDGVVDCLIHERGWFSNIGELFESGVASLDRDTLIDDATTNGSYDEIGGYGYSEDMDDDGDHWYVFQIDY